MKVESIVLGSIGTNCYIVTNEETKECFAVDMAECPQEYVNYIKNNGLEMKALFLTHGHFDHIMGIDDFLKAFPVPVYAGEDELPVIEDDRLNVSCMYGPKYAFHGAQPVRDGQVIECAGIEVDVLHTPGHTAGSTSLYCEKEKCLFSGDTIFAGTWGRTDLPTSSREDIMNSITNKILVLPDDTFIYPGHGKATMLKDEKPIYLELKPKLW